MTKQAQLQMIWPESRLESPPKIELADGYTLRQYRPEDKDAYMALMHSVGFKDFTTDWLDDALRKVLPGGFFIIEHFDTGAIVATALATHNPTAQFPFGGELSWVAAHPDHRGHRLGADASTAALRRMIDAGYRNIYLLTDDPRLAAIKTYLRMGFEPVINDKDMASRWERIQNTLMR
jgi:mycothiol synthase